MSENLMLQLNETKEAEYARYYELAKKVVAQKSFDNYYCVECQNDGCVDFLSVKLSDSEVSLVKTQQAETGEGIWALQEEIPFYDKLCKGDYYPVDIDFDAPLHKMGITMVYMANADAWPIKETVMVEISDEDYTALLAWSMQNRKAPFSRLVIDNPDLYRRLSKIIHNRFAYSISHMVFLDEIEKDVIKALGEPDVHTHIYYNCDDKKMEHVDVHIMEKHLSVVYESVKFFYSYTDFSDIDAIAMQEAYGVSTYAELVDKMRADFGHIKSKGKLEKFLIEHNIAFNKN